MSQDNWFRPPAEDETVPDMPVITYTIPSKPTPDEHDVAMIEDQILRLAFGKTMRSIRRRTIALVFLAGMIAGFVALGVILVVLLTKAGAQ